MKFLHVTSLAILISACGGGDDASPVVNPPMPHPAGKQGTEGSHPIATLENPDYKLSVSDPIAPAVYGGFWSRLIRADVAAAGLAIVEKRKPNTDWQIVGALDREGKYLDTDVAQIYEYRVGERFFIPAQPAAFDRVVTQLPCDAVSTTVSAYRVILTERAQSLCSPITFINGESVVIDAKVGMGEQSLVVTTKNLEFTARGLLKSFVTPTEADPLPPTAGAVSLGNLFNGRSAGTLKIFADKVKGKMHIVGLAENGANGVAGLRGANGAKGLPGLNAIQVTVAGWSSSTIKCLSKAFYGNMGGHGLPGGNGGPGGFGGNSLKLILAIPNFDSSRHVIHIAAGQGGQGGIRGLGGEPGPRGDAGLQTRECPGYTGSPAPASHHGAPGIDGPRGADGVTFPIEFVSP